MIVCAFCAGDGSVPLGGLSLKLFVPCLVLCCLASRCFGFVSRRIQGNDTFGDSLLECAHFPSPEVHVACRCAAQVFF